MSDGITDISQIETPDVGIQEFIHPQHGDAWFKDTAGNVYPLGGGSTAKSMGRTDAIYSTEATPNDIVVDISSIAGYTDGLVVNILQRAGNNTGAMTIDINGLGVKSIKKHGTIKPMAADDIVDGVLNAYNYILATGTFEWVGQIIDNSSAIIVGSISYLDFQPDAGANAALDLAILPIGYVLKSVAIKHDASWVGAAISAATMTVDNATTGLDSLTTVDVFRAPGVNVGAMAGTEASTTIVNGTTLGALQTTLALTGGVIDDLTAGDMRFSFEYSLPRLMV